MWLCFFNLLEILKYCTARVTSEAASQYVSALMEYHHQQFKKCYPSQKFIPKSHYMVHFPRLMSRYVHYNCFGQSHVHIMLSNRVYVLQGWTINIMLVYENGS